MKKKLCALLVAVILVCTVCPMAASAVTPRVRSFVPSLDFSGTTAYCELTVNTDYLTDKISATIKLWSGSTCLETWTASASGFLVFSDTVTVSKGEYTLTADVTINGTVYPQVSVTNTCK